MFYVHKKMGTKNDFLCKMMKNQKTFDIHRKTR